MVNDYRRATLRQIVAPRAACRLDIDRLAIIGQRFWCRQACSFPCIIEGFPPSGAPDGRPSNFLEKCQRLFRLRHNATSRTTAIMLTAVNLACVRGDRRLFEGVGFSLGAGQWLQVEGENGAGKTSLLRMVCGLLHMPEGEIRWNGELVGDIGDEYRADLLYLGHAGGIKEELTALENLRIGAALGGQSLDEAVTLKALQRLGLKGREDLPARFLSQGQKRRVALARLLTSLAKLWVLDEPFVALDVRAVDMLCAIIAEHLQNGGMALFTSHQAVNLGGSGSALRLAA